VLSFPSPPQGLSAFRKLREFRRLHETAYDPALVLDKKGKAGKLLSRKGKTPVLMNQKANSVADMAATLLWQARPMEKGEPTEDESGNGEVESADVRKAPRQGRVVRKHVASGEELWRGSVRGVEIRWRDVLDAEFAETWPEEVVHGQLEVSRHTAVWPPVEALKKVEAREVGMVEEVREEKEEEQQEQELSGMRAVKALEAELRVEIEEEEARARRG